MLLPPESPSESDHDLMPPILYGKTRYFRIVRASRRGATRATSTLIDKTHMMQQQTQTIRLFSLKATGDR